MGEVSKASSILQRLYPKLFCALRDTNLLCDDGLSNGGFVRGKIRTWTTPASGCCLCESAQSELAPHCLPATRAMQLALTSSRALTLASRQSAAPARACAAAPPSRHGQHLVGAEQKGHRKKKKKKHIEVQQKKLQLWLMYRVIAYFIAPLVTVRFYDHPIKVRISSRRCSRSSSLVAAVVAPTPLFSATLLASSCLRF